MSKDLKWIRLDNAARIFPWLISSRVTTVFRIAVRLQEPVKPELLQRICDRILPRFPYYRVRLRRGFFWNYLEENLSHFRVKPEQHFPCQPPSKKLDGGYLFRVLHYENRISVEFSHVLTDGNGATVFLNTLLREYLQEIGAPVVHWNGTMNLGEPAHSAEFEDSYRKLYQGELPKPRPRSKAWHLQSPLLPRGTNLILRATIPVEPLKQLAKQHKVSITEYAVAVQLWVLQEEMREKGIKAMPLRIMVPTNLRPGFKSRSMRNFFLTVTPGIDPRLGWYTFEEIISSVHHTMRFDLELKQILQQLSFNVSNQLATHIRLLPLWLKQILGPYYYRKLSSTLHSGVVTNLGRCDVPEEYRKHISSYEVLPNPNPFTKINLGLISYGDQLTMSYTCLTGDLTVPRKFFLFLREQGVPVTIESNLKT